MADVVARSVSFPRSPCMGAARTWGRLAVLCALIGTALTLDCIVDAGATSAHERWLLARGCSWLLQTAISHTGSR